MLVTHDGRSRSEPIHPPGTLEQYLPKDKHLGPVDLSGLEIKPKEETQEEKDRKKRVAEKPPIDECLSLYDFEVRRLCRLRSPRDLTSSLCSQAVAKSVLPTGAWAYCALASLSSRLSLLMQLLDRLFWRR